jgi:hypothetical protein
VKTQEIINQLEAERDHLKMVIALEGNSTRPGRLKDLWQNSESQKVPLAGVPQTREGRYRRRQEQIG